MAMDTSPAKGPLDLTSLDDDGKPPKLLAKILNYVDDVWLKIRCKGLHTKFRDALRMKEAWISTKVEVELAIDDHRSFLFNKPTIPSFFELNGRRFHKKHRLEAFEKLLQNIVSIRSFSYDCREGDDLPLIKALFQRIIHSQPLELGHFEFLTDHQSQLKPLPDFLRSISSTLESFTLVVSQGFEYSRRHSFDVVKRLNTNAIWDALSTCTHLKYCLAYHGGRIRIDTSVINNVLSQKKELKSLILRMQFGENAQEAIDIVKNLPSLEVLSVDVNASVFMETLIKNGANVTLPIKELRFVKERTDDTTKVEIQMFDMKIFLQGFDRFPKLNSLKMLGDDPAPLIDHIFNFWKPDENRPPLFVLDWYEAKMSVRQLGEMFEQVVINKGGQVLAVQSSQCILGHQSPFQSSARPVYLLVRNGKAIQFYVKGSWRLYPAGNGPSVFASMVFL